MPHLREGMLIGFVAVFLYLMLALGSYTTNDPGWSSTGTGVINNAGGPMGAWLADVFFSSFGYMAYLFPLMLAYRAWVLFRQRDRTDPFDWPAFAIRIIGLCLVMIASTALIMIRLPGVTALPFGAGGLLGQAAGGAVVDALSLVGGQLILVALLLFGITIFTNLSWLRLMDRLGALAVRLTCYVLDQGIRRWTTWRAHRASQETKKGKPRIPKTITLKPSTAPKVLPKPSSAARKPSSSGDATLPMFTAPTTGSLPSLELLDPADHQHRAGYSAADLEALSRLLERKLSDFSVIAEVVEVLPGPVVTRFELQLGTGVKVSKITGLAKDIARSLAVISVRVVEVIPGKSVVGIEIPNQDRALVNYRDVLASQTYQQTASPLALALGHDISGEPVVVDLAKMPHLLVAGTTGSGKSVALNAMLLSLLYKATPARVRLILVDPKMLELSVYAGIPHLLTPVITDMKEAANGLRWCVAEMERRYRLMSAMGVRNLTGFNRKISTAIADGDPITDPLWVSEEHYQAGQEQVKPPMLEPLPVIVVVIDELADMMMVVGKKVEELIARIAQKARAAGIHLILATQRPSVDVITGLIKANVPTRIAFQVSSRVDSRTILDQGGAEQLLGHGDMLYLPPGSGLPIRVHGAFVSDEEVHRVVANWQKRGEPVYVDYVVDDISNRFGAGSGGSAHNDAEQDDLYDQAVAFVLESRRASISAVQRKLRIGYNRAARLIEAMEASGVVSTMSSSGAREVLAPAPSE